MASSGKSTEPSSPGRAKSGRETTNGPPATSRRRHANELPATEQPGRRERGGHEAGLSGQAAGRLTGGVGGWPGVVDGRLDGWAGSWAVGRAAGRSAGRPGVVAARLEGWPGYWGWWLAGGPDVVARRPTWWPGGWRAAGRGGRTAGRLTRRLAGRLDCWAGVGGWVWWLGDGSGGQAVDRAIGRTAGHGGQAAEHGGRMPGGWRVPGSRTSPAPRSADRVGAGRSGRDQCRSERPGLVRASGFGQFATARRGWPGPFRGVCRAACGADTVALPG